MDQSGMVVNPARGRLNREKEYCPVPVRAREFGSRDSSAVGPGSACSFSTYRLNLVLTQGIPPAFHGGVIVHLFIPPTAIGLVPNSIRARIICVPIAL